MTAFMRTPSGLRNLAKFYSADVMVYVEGRCLPEHHKLTDTLTQDELYYAAVLKEINGAINYKIKVVGCKDSVAEYAKSIKNDNIKNCFCIVDSDWEGLLTSWLPDPRLIHTHGYSWENDFWTVSLIIRVLRDLMPLIPGIEDNIVKNTVERAAHRLARISRIDCVTKLHGTKFIPSSETSVGVPINPSIYFFVPTQEIRKFNKNVESLRESVKSCSVSRDVYNALKDEVPEKIIRGHLWEFLSICVISYFYKIFSGEKSIPTYIIKSTAINAFARAAHHMLDPLVMSHYRAAVNKALIASVELEEGVGNQS